MHRPQYTEEQIRDNPDGLPGFKSPADVFDVVNTSDGEYSLWQPVLSATITANFSGVPHILTGNRSAEGNVTHVDIASTPTSRVPNEDAGSLLGQSVPFCLNGQIDPSNPFVSDSLSPSLAYLPDSTDTLSAKVMQLLSLKLELGSVIERSARPVGRASLARCVAGFSYLSDDHEGRPLFEPLIMFGVVVGLKSDVARQIPEVTGSYSHLGWVPLDTYLRGVATKNVAEVIAKPSPKDVINFCVRGLCNITSASVVRDPNEVTRHLTEDYILPVLD